MVASPFAGMGSSYVVRTVTTMIPWAADTTVGAVGMDFIAEFTPWNAPSFLQFGGVKQGGASITTFSGSYTSFISGTAVKSFRPVAACLKFIPSGTIAGRSGVIGLGYSPNKIYQGSTIYVPSQAMTMTLAQHPTGAVPHEAVWLPSFEDARFGTQLESNVNGVGSVQIVGLNVDATGSGTQITANGYLEMTVVWEWEPAVAVSGQSNGVVPSLHTPTRTTLNDVLSTIGDAGRFVLQHAGGAMAAGAYQYAQGVAHRRRPGMLTY